MPRFSETSFSRLSTCDVELQTLFFEVIKTFDCVVLEGHRGEEAQNKAFEEGHSKLKWPLGNHNSMPSMAVDVAPFEPGINVDWKDIQRFHLFAGFVLGIAQRLKDEGKMTKSIRWGGDWNRDYRVKDEKFRDLPHFELVP